jgi:ferric-dicitrate binding protein FerR (iron transport regulator)
MKNKVTSEKPDWDLIGSYLAREATTFEKEQVETWANQSEKNREEVEKTKQLLENTDLVYELKKFDSEAAWNKVAAQITPVRKINSSKKIVAKFYRYAAIFLVAILIGVGGYYIANQNTVSEIYAEISPSGTLDVQEHILQDGTVVTLNNNSKISFPKRFKGNVREVTITGEAFFDVEPNPEKPFIINAGEAQVKVLGTSFNISAYPEQEKVEVIVETGKVQVTRKSEPDTDENHVLLLNPGEKGTFSEQNNKLEKNVNADRNYLAWKTHNLVFEETPLHQVISYLKKVYRIDIQLTDKELNNLVLTAEFNKKPIDFILNVIQLTFYLDLREENGQYILSKQEIINN